MLPSQHLTAFLTYHFPRLAPTLASEPGRVLPTEQQLRVFAAFTRQAALLGRLTQLRACLRLAGQLLAVRDAELTAALHHTYLPALHLEDVPQDPQLLRQFMPAPLYRLLRQRPVAA